MVHATNGNDAHGAGVRAITWHHYIPTPRLSHTALSLGRRSSASSYPGTQEPSLALPIGILHARSAPTSHLPRSHNPLMRHKRRSCVTRTRTHRRTEREREKERGGEARERASERERWLAGPRRRANVGRAFPVSRASILAPRWSLAPGSCGSALRRHAGPSRRAVPASRSLTTRLWTASLTPASRTPAYLTPASLTPAYLTPCTST